jgi:uncharacterized membrane protein
VDALWLAVWWLAWLALALLYLPLTARVFGGLVDGGWACARTLGLGIASYLCWLAASLELVPFTRASALAAVLLPALILWARARDRRALGRLVSRRWRMALATELVFGATFLVFVALRAMRPEIAGLEKFMDYGFAASAARSAFMPPPDMWFAGEPINYYYYGHYALAFVSKASGVPLPIAYNLMIAQLAGLTAALGFTLTAQLTRALAGGGRRRLVLGGLLGAALAVFGSNLHGFLYGVALPAAESAGLRETEFRSAMQIRAGHYWYADATRYIGHNPPTSDRLIHEFPFYAFLVADLHGHVSSLPFVLTVLALLLGHVLGSRRGRPPPLSRSVLVATGAGFGLGLVRMTNTWDLPIYGVVSASLLGVHALHTASSRGRAVVGTALLVAWIAAVTALVSLPFALHFERHYGELFLVQQRSPLYQLAVLWGVPVLLIAAFARARLARALRRHSLPLPLSVWLVLAACAVGLLVVPEVVAVRDIYPEPYERGNTYFKLTFQAFVLLSLLAASATAAMLRGPGRHGRAALAGCLLAPLFVYLPLGIRGHHGPPRFWRLRGLDGLAFLEGRRPGEGQAAAWLRAKAAPGAALLEADGDSYSDAGRLSMATGIPTVLGWYVHEWLWRGAKRDIDDRRAQVRVAYEFPRLTAVHELLERYGVRYVVIGDLERKRFPALDEAGLESLGRVAFETGSVRIIEVERTGR